MTDYPTWVYLSNNFNFSCTNCEFTQVKRLKVNTYKRLMEDNNKTPTVKKISCNHNNQDYKMMVSQIQHIKSINNNTILDL